MKRAPNLSGGLVLVAAGLIALSACGDSAETGIEQLIESQGGGDVDLDLDGDGGFSVQTEDGGMSIDEDGNFVVTDENGDVVTGNVDDNGDLTVESEDGSFSSGAATELPDDWPADVPDPAGLDIQSVVSMSESDTEGFVVTGSTTDDGFADSYASALESAGFERESEFTTEGATQLQFGNGTWNVSFGVFSDTGGPSQVNVTVFTAE